MSRLDKDIKLLPLTQVVNNSVPDSEADLFISILVIMIVII